MSNLKIPMVIFAMIVFPCVHSAQIPLALPSLNEVLSGHGSIIKPPTSGDLKNFTNGHQRHLALLDRRSEKAYRKSFLKFVELEDKLLYSLCDSNEFRANMLMRSAMASYGKLESDRISKSSASQRVFHQKKAAVSIVAELAREALPEEDFTDHDAAKENHHAQTAQTGSELYSDYMAKRVRIYEKTFADGTKQQRKMHRKLKLRAHLWKAYKAEDRRLTSRFADRHHGVMKFARATPDFETEMMGLLPDYHRALAMAGEGIVPDNPISGEGLFTAIKEQLKGGELLGESNIEAASGPGDLLNKLRHKSEDTGSDEQDRTAAANEDVRIETGEDKEKAGEKRKTKKKGSRQPDHASNNIRAKRFWDRLYFGGDIDWESPTGYYPEGLGLTLTGGYKLSARAGLNLELRTLFNASKMGMGEDDRFRSTLVSNHTAGANMDFKIWKFVHVGAGAEAIFNQLEAPLREFPGMLRDTKFTIGMPLILRLRSPIQALGGTQIEVRYDLNSKNNIKPQFDFRVGFLIGK